MLAWLDHHANAVMAVATVVLVVVAILQIVHLNRERRDRAKERTDDQAERKARLDAVAKYHGLNLRHHLRDGVEALDALSLHNRQLGSWRQQAALAHNFVIAASRRMEQMAEAMIERHSGASNALEQMLKAVLEAYEATRELQGPAALTMNDAEVTTLYNTARKRSLVCLNLLETELGLLPLPPIYQPPSAPGATNQAHSSST